MKPIEYEISRLKDVTSEMFDLVRQQLIDTKKVLFKNDAELAADVMRKETRINAFEINIDRDCEDILALQAPVATDLRFTMAVLKISASLERIGDHAYRISGLIYDDELKTSDELLELLNVEQLYIEMLGMLDDAIKAFEEEDVKIAKQVFKKDKVLDKINQKTPKLLDEYAQTHKIKLDELILLTKVVGKLERTGDMITNIAEEVIFFVESKVIKHKKKNKRIRKKFSDLFK